MEYVAGTATALANSVLAILFLVAAVLKTGNLRTFQTTLRSFPVPRRLIGVLSIVIPLTEIAIGVGLLLSEPYANAMAMALLLAFSLAAQYAIHRRLIVPCSCFGEASGRLSINTVWRNVALATIAVPGLVLPGRVGLLHCLYSVFLIQFVIIVLELRSNLRTSAKLV